MRLHGQIVFYNQVHGLIWGGSVGGSETERHLTVHNTFSTDATVTYLNKLLHFDVSPAMVWASTVKDERGHTVPVLKNKPYCNIHRLFSLCLRFWRVLCMGEMN
jgi:hypothetical protein